MLFLHVFFYFRVSKLSTGINNYMSISGIKFIDSESIYEQFPDLSLS